MYCCWPNACKCLSEEIINRLFAGTRQRKQHVAQGWRGAALERSHVRSTIGNPTNSLWYFPVWGGGASLPDRGLKTATTTSQMSLTVDLHPGTWIISLKNSQCGVYKQHLLHLMDGCSLSLVPANSPTRFIISATVSSPKHHAQTHATTTPSVFVHWPSLLCVWALTVVRFHI